MRCYALSGQTDQAIRQYQQLREALQRDLDSAPDAASQRLYRAIVAGRLTRRERDPTSNQRATATATEPIDTPPKLPEPSAQPPDLGSELNAFS
jgi:DNA-binding SARP family transcriptional activator